MPIWRGIMGGDLRGNVLVRLAGKGALESEVDSDFEGTVGAGSLRGAAPRVPIGLNAVALGQLP